MNINEISLAYNVPVDCIQDFENQGFFDEVKQINGKKIYEEKDIQKLSFLMTLKNVGMSIQDMKKYIQYISEGDSTLSQRIDMLTRYRQALLEKAHTCYKSIDILDYFIYLMETKQ